MQRLFSLTANDFALERTNALEEAIWPLDGQRSLLRKIVP
jgi:hypothetical protein